MWRIKFFLLKDVEVERYLSRNKVKIKASRKKRRQWRSWMGLKYIVCVWKWNNNKNKTRFGSQYPKFQSNRTSIKLNLVSHSLTWKSLEADYPVPQAQKPRLLCSCSHWPLFTPKVTVQSDYWSSSLHIHTSISKEEKKDHEPGPSILGMLPSRCPQHRHLHATGQDSVTDEAASGLGS